jgi:predicted HicB family RNase H-like nuclease
MLEYKGYSGVLEVDDEVGVLFGRVIGLRDVITFEGDTVPEAVQAFHDSVDDYLTLCAKRGEKPEKPFSGKFLVRIKQDLHRALANMAELRGMSMNALVEEALNEKVSQGTFPGAKPGRTIELVTLKQAQPSSI